MDPATLRLAAEQLKDATVAHAEWHEDLLRSIFCGVACEHADLTPAAHRNCSLGQWYFERAPVELRDLPAFLSLGDEHERLHRIAAQMLCAVATNGSIVRADFDELVATNARLRLEIDALRLAIDAALLSRDSLTGAYGRVEMLPELTALHEQTERVGKPCCIVFMDVDHLKWINDSQGHQVGDAVLSGVVHHLEAHLRPQDKVYRYGGDEFLVSLPGTDLAIARSVVTRIRESLAEQLLIAGPHGAALRITASFGIALLDPAVGVEESIGRADQALMLAKATGRNRAMTWDSSVTTSTRWPQLRIDETPK